MTNRKIFIFDFDGTITDSGINNYKIINNILPKVGIEKLTLNEIENLRNFETQLIFKKFKIPFYKIPFIYIFFTKEYRKSLKVTDIHKDLKNVLNELNIRNVKMYIVSSSHKKSIITFLKMNNIEYFKRVEGGRSYFRKDKIISKIIKNDKLDKNEVLYIGDETRDIEAAKRAGVKSVAVTWGFNSKESLIKENPHILITRPRELLLL